MEMKESLYERMLGMLERLNSRIEQLEKHIEEYKDSNDFENAMKCDIKRTQLLLVQAEIRRELF